MVRGSNDLQNEYSIWEGFACRGYPVMTILRSKIIVANERSLGSSSDAMEGGLS